MLDGFKIDCFINRTHSHKEKKNILHIIIIIIIIIILLLYYTYDKSYH